MSEPFQKLGKLSLAILENFVASVLGKKFIDELRQPTDAVLAIGMALQNSEERFVRQFEDRVFAEKIFKQQISINNLPLLEPAVGKYYARPTDPDFRTALNQIFTDSLPYLAPERIGKAVDFYIRILTEELALIDENFRENIRALADLRGEQSQQEMIEVLKRVEELLRVQQSKQGLSQVVTTLFTIHPCVINFIGRTNELDILKAAFSHGAMITGITGGGGIGKTELARKLAQEAAENFPDACMEIDLLGVSETPLKPEEVMHRLLEPFYPGQKLPDDPTQLYGLYKQTFSSRKSLLLLDNAANAAQVRSLIPPAPSAAIMTSRQHFTLSEFDLYPLRLDVLPQNRARELLRVSAAKLRKASNDNIDKLAKICGQLPLALRVAAALLNDRDDWTLGILLERLEDEHTRLQRLKRSEDLDVEATLNLSYEFLPSGLQKCFRYLGVLPAPFQGISAAEVWGMDKDQSDNVIGKFLNLSLLNFLPAPEGDGGSYEMHDLTRLFAVQHLVENHIEAQDAVARHAGHFLELARRADDEYEKGGESALIGLNQFRSIWPHLFAAYNRLLPGQRTFPRPDGADEWLGRFPSNCPYVLALHLSPQERIRLLEHALQAVQRSGNKIDESVHLVNLGNAHYETGDAHQAIVFFERYLVIARETANRQEEGQALNNLGMAYVSLGNARTAIECCGQSLTIAREIGNRREEGHALGNLGNAHLLLGETQNALTLYEQELAIVREISDRRTEGIVLGNLGNAHNALGNISNSIDYYGQALIISRELDDRLHEGNCLGNLAASYVNLGDAHRAIEFSDQRLVMAREIGDRRGESSALANMATAYAILGDTHKAIEFGEQSLVICREIGDRRAESTGLGNLGSTYGSLGDAHKAIEFYDQLLVIAREIGDRPNEAFGSWGLAVAYEALGQIKEAISFLQVSVEIKREIGHRDAEELVQALEDLRKKLV